MLRKILGLALLATLAGCCTDDHDGACHDGDRRYQGSGRVVRQERSVGDFHAVRLEGLGEVLLSAAPARSVEVEADDNLEHRVRTEVKHGVLIVGLDPGSYSDFTLRVRVGAPALDRIELTGAGEIEGRISDVDALAVSLSGTGAITLDGYAGDLTVDVDGAGAFHGFGLTSSDCTARLAGAGRIEVTATEALDATVTGLGSIRYDGAPDTVETAVSGLGSILPR